MIINIKRIRLDFPMLSQKVNNHQLVYLDNAASTQKPYSVINAEKKFYEKSYASVHRGIHTLSMNATVELENVRHQVAKFINASSREIIFVKGTTEGINLVAYSYLMNKFNKNDNIIITCMEHHSNILPWQIIAKKIGLEIRILPITQEGKLDISLLYSLIDKKTKLLSITHVSNVLGTINPVNEIIKLVKKFNIITLLDGAQAIMHQKIDVKKIDCDFYVFSSHKIYGPTGVGILYGKKNILNKMTPWQGGGAMVKFVSFKKEAIYSQYPWCFEAGTPNIAGIIGLGEALKYINNLGIDNIKHYEKKLINYTMKKLINSIPDIIIYGPKKRAGIISFNIKNYHPYDIGSLLDKYGIAIRTGHHCAMPLLDFYKTSSMCRISLSFYNNENDIDLLIFYLIKTCNFLKKSSLEH